MKQKPSEILKIYQPNNEQLSLKEIFDDLRHISDIKKCSFCGCNQDTLKEFSELAASNNEKELAENALKIEAKIANQKKYECIACNPCYPADISNLLFEMGENDATEKVGSCSSDSCSSQSCLSDIPKPKNKWPIERGNYFIGNEKASVAINTLSNTDLPKELIKTLKDKIAIVGYCETENIGVEKIVKNIISNPNIRTLIVCGNESGKDMMGGHFSGQAIISLHTNGINEKNRIIGAKGKRPVMKNLNKEQVEHFQSQVEIIELIGNNSIDDIKQNVAIALSKEKGAFKHDEIKTVSNNEIIAKNPEKLRLDKKGYFVIIPDKSEHKIFVEYYANTGELLQTIVGDDASSIYYTIIEKDYISRLDHCAYLGKELTKAEYFIKYDIPYRQDKALGEITDE
jgi:tetrahydromethanopterin S-methyltransferase subunit A